MKFIFLLVALSAGCLVFAQTKNERLRSILDHAEFSWKIYPYKDFNFIVEENRFADQQINSIKNDFSRIRNEVIYFLGGSNLIDTANIVIVDSREKNEKRTRT